MVGKPITVTMIYPTNEELDIVEESGHIHMFVPLRQPNYWAKPERKVVGGKQTLVYPLLMKNGKPIVEETLIPTIHAGYQSHVNHERKKK